MCVSRETYNPAPERTMRRRAADHERSRYATRAAARRPTTASGSGASRHFCVARHRRSTVAKVSAVFTMTRLTEEQYLLKSMS
jgi:hypothetical protein